ncbi:MAG: ribosomal-protein-alanine N-acetyltransferase [Thermoprotei archaeon]|nr:MAG: ribosomal-protein-alanine N-acetyltransferase [Thermoprotei archaeon]
MASYSSLRADKGLILQKHVNVSVREARKEELEDILVIENLSFKDPYPLFILEFYLKLCPETFLVAEHNGKVVGFVIGLKRGWGWGHIISIAVHPSFRGRGIGKTLMVECIKRLSSMGTKRIRLEVRVSNEKAIRLYKELGFEIKDVLPRYYKDGEDAYLMVLDLGNVQ